jgi:hypothetical protein
MIDQDIYERNRNYLLGYSLNDPDPLKRDIAWTLFYVMEGSNHGIETCVSALASWSGSESIYGHLTDCIRARASQLSTGDQLTDWVNAQKTIARGIFKKEV